MDPASCLPSAPPAAMEEEEEAIGFLDKVLEDEDVFLLEECELGTPTSPGSGSPFLVAVKVGM